MRAVIGKIFVFLLLDWYLLTCAVTLIILLALLCAPAHAQNDVTVPGTNPFLTLLRGGSWGSGAGCSSGSGCFANNNFIWQPPTADSTVCIAITNNNPTNSHSITLSLQQTLDASVSRYNGITTKWGAVPITGVTFPATVAANSTNAYFFKSTAAAKLALLVSGTAAAGGSPDTIDIVVAQPSTASSCASAPNGTSIVNAIGAIGDANTIPTALNLPLLLGGHQWLSGVGDTSSVQHVDVDSGTRGFLVGTGSSSAQDATNGATIYSTACNAIGSPCFNGNVLWGGRDDTNANNLSQVRNSPSFGLMVGDQFAWASSLNKALSNTAASSYEASSEFANPAAASLLLAVNANTTTINAINLHRVTIACSAACDVVLNRISDSGTACAASTAFKAFDPAIGTASNANVLTQACTTNPTIVNRIVHLFVPAGGSYTWDGSGYTVSPNVTLKGFDLVLGGAVTGTVAVQMDWTERI